MGDLATTAMGSLRPLVSSVAPDTVITEVLRQIEGSL